MHSPLIALLPLLLVHTLHGATITEPILIEFDEPEHLEDFKSYSEDGFKFSVSRSAMGNKDFSLDLRDPPPGLLNIPLGLNTIPYNGSTYGVVMFNAVGTLEDVQERPFSLITLNLALYSASSDSLSMEIIGTRADGSKILMNYFYEGTVIGQPSDFQLLEFSEAWTNLTEVTLANYWFAAPNFRAARGYSIDNIEVRLIPEPSSSLLFVSGILAAAFYRSRCLGT